MIKQVQAIENCQQLRNCFQGEKLSTNLCPACWKNNPAGELGALVGRSVFLPNCKNRKTQRTRASKTSPKLQSHSKASNNATKQSKQLLELSKSEAEMEEQLSPRGGAAQKHHKESWAMIKNNWDKNRQSMQRTNDGILMTFHFISFSF